MINEAVMLKTDTVTKPILVAQIIYQKWYIFT